MSSVDEALQHGEGESDVGECTVPVAGDLQLKVPGKVVEAVRGEFRQARAGEPHGVQQRGIGKVRAMAALAVQQGGLPRVWLTGLPRLRLTPELTVLRPLLRWCRWSQTRPG